MRSFVVDCWNGVMDYRFNPLKHIPDLQVRHMMLQVLAWLWYKVPLPPGDPGGEHD
jgi:hypothetical protein